MRRVLADEVLGQLLYGRPGALGLALQGRLAPAIEAVVGGDLDQAHARSRVELLDLGDFHSNPFSRRDRRSLSFARIITHQCAKEFTHPWRAGWIDVSSEVGLLGK